MKRSELKKILKPLVQECIKESLLEDGLISSIIAEVVKGVSSAPLIVESAPPTGNLVRERLQRNAFTPGQSAKLKEHKNKLMAAIGGGNYNGADLFEGTTPVAAQASATEQARPLSGQSPGDKGVDITSLFGSVENNWNAHMNVIKEGK
jgi:hypothetical protein|tara:strand:+ start:128 stop:574 length:447 start_codon:yes stop_codon:yes gene_type:complete